MGRKAPTFRRFFKSPTYVAITRPLYAIPIAAALCALLVVGGPRLFNQQSATPTSHYTADEKIKDTPLPLTTAPPSTATNTTTPSVSSPSTTHPSQASGAAPSAPTSTPATLPVASSPSCPPIVSNLTATYNQKISDAKNLLDHNLITALLDIALQNTYIDNYNISVTGAYNQAEAQAQQNQCSLTLPEPRLMPHRDS